MTPEEFVRDFKLQVDERARHGVYTEDAFFEVFCEYLTDDGELNTAERVSYAPPRSGMRVDGYGGLPEDNVLSLIAMDFRAGEVQEPLRESELKEVIGRLTRFVERALDPVFRRSLEEADPGFGLADTIATHWQEVERVHLVVISSRFLSDRAHGIDVPPINNRRVSVSVWDMGRLSRREMSGRHREDIVIDLADDPDGSLTLLHAHTTGSVVASYLSVMPGAQLARIYDRWGTRLLEQNVRVFLQARGVVNRGISQTIITDPEMFFAYNNGIAATADWIDTVEDAGRLRATRLHNFQIVNGGQTTASLHLALRRGIDLTRVYVQLKLTVVEHNRWDKVVPRISEYANTQNRVSVTDFSSNSPFQVQLEKLSRETVAPPAPDQLQESRWYYERVRGQYATDRQRLEGAPLRVFDRRYPRSQFIDKSSLAKYTMTWDCKPDSVSRGAQKNFIEFTRIINNDWKIRPQSFDECYFQHMIAKAIIFRRTEALVRSQPWNPGGGLLSRIVPYAIARLVAEAERLGRPVDLDAVWRSQSVPPRLASALIVAAESVHPIILGQPERKPNPLEWAKDPRCWEQAREVGVSWPDGWLGLPRSSGSAPRIPRAPDPHAVFESDADWGFAAEWGIVESRLSEEEAQVLRRVANQQTAVGPLVRQRAAILLSRLRGAGFPS